MDKTGKWADIISTGGVAAPYLVHGHAKNNLKPVSFLLDYGLVFYFDKED